ncbi:DUF418 domain-containing protein [Nonomuraea lactucae]|uniref:DUF418 domain-containing protein n=1 Tax=Nonomuraea lactucae TaxID=2249762 RepID=UPI0013B3F3C9|nr:DUF418 domain-containing protein [Nonomuraea lactucae]
MTRSAHAENVDRWDLSNVTNPSATPVLAGEKPGTGPPPPISRNRLLGVDVVRATAILSMIFVHVWPTVWVTRVQPPAEPVGVLEWLNSAITNRSMSLFVFCAGVSVALLTGGARRPAGGDVTVARRRLALRSAALLPFGLILLIMGESILFSYCMWFLLLLPLVRLRSRTLFAASAVFSLISPLCQFLAQNHLGSPPIPGDEFSILTSPGDWPAWLFWFVTGPDTSYAVPLLLAGMGLGRLDLRSHAVRVRVMTAGLAVTVVFAMVAWLAAGPLGGARAVPAGQQPVPGSGEMPWILMLMMRPFGMFDISIPMVATMIGTGLFLMGAFLIVMDRAPWQRILWPFAATGSLALTAYIGHFLLIRLLGRDEPASFHVFVSVAATVVVFSTVWRSWWRRGPLEWLVHRVTDLAVPYERRAHHPATIRPAPRH